MSERRPFGATREGYDPPPDPPTPGEQWFWIADHLRAIRTTLVIIAWLIAGSIAVGILAAILLSDQGSTPDY